jgi:hypothetical protein
MTYATPEEVHLAERLGYTHDCNQQRGHVFRKDARHIWACRADHTPDGPLAAWMTADLVDGRYRNHRKFLDLEDALRRPI